MRRNEFAVVAVAALLLLGGCTGGSPAGPSTTTGMTDETTVTTTTNSESTTSNETTTNNETATNSENTATATETAARSPETAETTTTPATADESNESGADSLFEYYGVTMNYSAGGDLDAEQVARSHLQALDEVESVTIVSTSRTETSNWSSSQYLRTEYNSTHQFHRQNGSGMEFAIYDGPELKAMKVGGENGTEHLRIVNEDDSGNVSREVPEPGESDVYLLAKLQTMPYEKVGTVERNGTTLTKYEATGPGYYGAQENLTVESFDSTLLVGENGLVRHFHHEIAFESRGQTKHVETTLRYEAVGTTDVTVPDWLDEVRDEGNGTDE